MFKIAILIIGPESSGTKMLTKIFINLGFEGSFTDYQPFDINFPQGNKIVWRRSLPHGRKWVNVQEFKDRLEAAGYDRVIVVGIVREMSATLQSQVIRGHCSNLKEAEANYKHALEYLFSYSDYLITYESIVLSKELSIKRMLNFLEIDQYNIDEIDINIVNMNEKYN